MCVISIVHDHYNPIIPYVLPATYQPNPEPVDLAKLLGVTDATRLEKAVAELWQLIADFRAAIEAAKVVDKLTGQPDCLDPAKASLEDRVSALEKALSAQTKKGESP